MIIKKKVSLILIICIISQLFCNTCFVSAESEYQNLVYSVDGNVVAIKGCADDISGEVSIPQIIDGYTVKTIGSYAFDGRNKITSLEIPNGVEKIEYRAFRGCTGLTEITIPDSVTEIGDDIFRDCSNLKKIRLSNNIEKINSYMFSGCTSLEDIVIPASVKTIGSYAFDGRNKITSLEIPNGVEKIEYRAFRGCTGLTETTIPDSVAEIGDDIFRDCNIVVYGNENSAIHQYCEKNNIDFIITGHTTTTKQETQNELLAKIKEGAYQGTYRDEHKKYERGVIIEIENKQAHFISYPLNSDDEVEAYEYYMNISYDTKKNKYFLSGLSDSDELKEASEMFGSGLLTHSVDGMYDIYISEFSDVINGELYGTYTPGIFSMYGEVGTFTAQFTEEAEYPEINRGDFAKLLGTYNGTYTADQGKTGGSVTIKKGGGKYYAEFSFYPLSENPDVESGSYRMQLSYNSLTKKYSFVGEKWIDKAPTYEFVNLIGAFNGDVFSGDVYRHSNGTRTGSFKFEKNNGFNLEKDAWSIRNSKSGFSYYENYLIPIERYYEVCNGFNATILASASGWQSVFGKFWGGNCFGMSGLSVLNYKKNIELKNYFSNNKKNLNNYGYDYQTGEENSIRLSNEVVELIERMQISQKTTQFSNSEVFKTGNHKDKITKLLNYLQGTDPTPLVICLEYNFSGHAVVTNTIQKPIKTSFNGSDDFYAIQVYDPNTPYDGNDLKNPLEVYSYSEKRFVYVNPKTGEWYYLLNPLKGKEEWWGDKTNYVIAGNSTLRCYDVTKYSDKFINNNLTIEPLTGQTYAFVSGSNINLSSNGSTFSINGREQKINSNVDYTPFYGTTLESENDKFIGKVVFDGGKISASDMESADVVYFSNDNILSISVDDDSEYEVDAENNKVTLNASDTALFDITLDNDNSTEFSAVRINGTSSSGEVTISLDDNGVINVDGNVNDVDAQITVEGSKKVTETFECDDIKELDGYSINDASEKEKTSFGSEVSDWAKEEVEEAYDENLVPEVLVGKDLTQKVDRAEFAAIAVALYENLTGSKATTANNPFNDIYGNACEDDILKAYNLDITAGTSATTFEPNVNITREQMATMLTRAYKKSEFKDWTIEKDADYPLNFMGVQKFADDNEISDYAKESVYFMARWDIIKGIGDNKFAPKNSATLGESYGYATREQALIIALRSVKHL